MKIYVVDDVDLGLTKKFVDWPRFRIRHYRPQVSYYSDSLISRKHDALMLILFGLDSSGLIHTVLVASTTRRTYLAYSNFCKP